MCQELGPGAIVIARENFVKRGKVFQNRWMRRK